MSDPSVILYDLASTATPQTFSGNTWKTRLVLNYKRIPYRTIFVHFPDIPETLEAAGIPPTHDTGSRYSVPAIVDRRDPHNVVHLADSALIADYLEKTNPEPRLYPPGQDGVQEQRALEKLILKALFPGLIPLGVPAEKNLLNERDWEFFVKTRKEYIGTSVDEFIASGTHEEKVAKLVKGLTDLAREIDARDCAAGFEAGTTHDWPFGHDKPVYADFVLVAALVFASISLAEIWASVKENDGARWARLMKTCEPYMQVV